MNEAVAGFGSVVRGIVYSAGGGLITSGAVTDQQWQLVAGGAAVLVGLVASLVRNRLLKKKIA